MAIVETCSGRIEGVEQEGVQVFRGVPYARPPVGPLRFAAPVREEPWAGVHKATEFGFTPADRERAVWEGLL